MNRIDLSFDPLDYIEQFSGCPTSHQMAHDVAKRERNAKLRELRAKGYMVKGWTLTGQLRPYASFGVPDGRVRNVYMIRELSVPAQEV